jgi:hypothetical protein
VRINSKWGRTGGKTIPGGEVAIALKEIMVGCKSQGISSQRLNGSNYLPPLACLPSLTGQYLFHHKTCWYFQAIL